MLISPPKVIGLAVCLQGLKPARVYWYRFTDEHGFGSRVGRTITAPSDQDSRTVRFAFVSCQNVQQGASTAYRRMIWEDEQKAAEVNTSELHLTSNKPTDREICKDCARVKQEERQRASSFQR